MIKIKKILTQKHLRRSSKITLRSGFLDIFLYEIQNSLKKKEISNKPKFRFNFNRVPLLFCLTPYIVHPFWYVRHLYMNSLNTFVSNQIKVLPEKTKFYWPNTGITKKVIPKYPRYYIYKKRKPSKGVLFFFQNRFDYIYSRLLKFKSKARKDIFPIFPQIYTNNNKFLSQKWKYIYKLCMEKIATYLGNNYRHLKNIRNDLRHLGFFIFKNKFLVSKFFIEIIRLWFRKRHINLISMYQKSYDKRINYNFTYKSNNGKSYKKNNYFGFDRFLFRKIYLFFLKRAKIKNRQQRFVYSKAFFFLLTKYISDIADNFRVNFVVSLYYHFSSYIKKNRMIIYKKKQTKLKKRFVSEPTRYFNKYFMNVFKFGLMKREGFVTGNSRLIFNWKIFSKLSNLVRAKTDKFIKYMDLDFILNKIRKMYFKSTRILYSYKPKYDFKRNINFHRLFLNTIPKSRIFNMYNKYNVLPFAYNTKRLRFIRYEMPVVYYTILKWKNSIQVILSNQDDQSLFVSTPNHCLKRISAIMGVEKVLKYIFLRTFRKKRAYKNPFMRSLVARNASNYLRHYFRGTPHMIIYRIKCTPKPWDTDKFLTSFNNFNLPNKNKKKRMVKKLNKLNIRKRVNIILKLFTIFDDVLISKMNRKLFVGIFIYHLLALRRSIVFIISNLFYKKNFLYTIKLTIKCFRKILSRFMLYFIKGMLSKKEIKKIKKKKKRMFRVFKSIRKKFFIFFYSMRKGYFKTSRLFYIHSILYQPNTPHCAPLKLRRKKRR